MLFRSMALVEEKIENYRNFDTSLIEDELASEQEKNVHQELKASIEDLKNLYEVNINSATSPLLVQTAVHNELNQLFLSTLNILNTQNLDQHQTHKSIRTILEANQSIGKMNTLIKTLALKSVNENKLEELEENIEKAQNYLNTLMVQIEEIEGEGDNERVAELKSLVTRYYLVGQNVSNLISTTVKYYPVLNMSSAEINNYFGYADIHSYQITEKITYQKFLLNNNAVSTDYANVYSPTRTSNAQSNAFDFIYFGLETTSFIIIIFTVVIAAGMLAGEHSNGTLKLLMIRPYSRNKILASKFLAPIIFATIFLLFSTIILFLIGFFTMGADFTPVLGIFNATLPFVASPIVLVLIYLICLIFKVLIYVIIAVAISTIFRSNVAAVGISTTLYFLLSILGTIFASSYWYGFLPLSNLDLFKYFGGAFVAGGSGGPIALLFSSPIFYGGTFGYSLLITLGIGAILTACTFWIFKKREIK